MKNEQKDTSTELAKAQQFAIDIIHFKKLVQGDLKSALNFLLVIDHNEDIFDLVTERMYELYVKNVAERGKEIEEEQNALMQ